jgi:hypothetical protein
MEKRPNVFPKTEKETPTVITNPLNTKEEHTVSTDEAYEQQKFNVAGQIYSAYNGQANMDSAIEAMKRRTEEQFKAREEVLAKSIQSSEKYQKNFEEAKRAEVKQEVKPITTTQIKSPTNNINISTLPMTSLDTKTIELSQPQFNTAYDIIPLPSEGKLYRSKKANVKVSFLTTADENILTSPNLLKSGQFLEVLINRKLLENDIRYRDLHVGDRNAIMLWLRATSYGEMYPVTVYDENGDPFDTEIDLSTLKTKNLGAEPDAEGYFSFVLPQSKKNIKFKLLTVGDVDDIEKLVDQDVKNDSLVNNSSTYILERQIVEINGSRDKNDINNLANNMLIRDANELRSYIDSIESGVDLEIEVPTPRGGSIKTFLPLNVRFFWPNARL